MNKSINDANVTSVIVTVEGMDSTKDDNKIGTGLGRNYNIDIRVIKILINYLDGNDIIDVAVEIAEIY